MGSGCILPPRPGTTYTSDSFVWVTASRTDKLITTRCSSGVRSVIFAWKSGQALLQNYRQVGSTIAHYASKPYHALK